MTALQSPIVVLTQPAGRFSVNAGSLLSSAISGYLSSSLRAVSWGGASLFSSSLQFLASFGQNSKTRVAMRKYVDVMLQAVQVFSYLLEVVRLKKHAHELGEVHNLRDCSQFPLHVLVANTKGPRPFGGPLEFLGEHCPDRCICSPDQVQVIQAVLDGWKVHLLVGEHHQPSYCGNRSGRHQTRTAHVLRHTLTFIPDHQFVSRVTALFLFHANAHSRFSLCLPHPSCFGHESPGQDSVGYR